MHHTPQSTCWTNEESDQPNISLPVGKNTKILFWKKNDFKKPLQSKTKYNLLRWFSVEQSTVCGETENNCIAEQ